MRPEERWCLVSATPAGLMGSLWLGKLETPSQVAECQSWRKCPHQEVSSLVEGAAA